MSYDVQEVSRSELAQRTGALQSIHAGRLGALIVRGFLEPSAAADAVRRLESEGLDVRKTRFAREFGAQTYGACLDQSESGLEPYFAEVPRFNAAVRTLFGWRGEGDPHPPIDAQFLQVLGVLAGARPVEVPRDTQGASYSWATIRSIPEGEYIPPHCENEQLGRPPYRELATELDGEVVMSFYLTLASPERGGELWIYPGVDWRSYDRSHVAHGQPQLDLRDDEATVLAPGPGDLLVFDGGRNFHRVAPVGGPRRRWTMGGFLSFDRAGKRVLAWA